MTATVHGYTMDVLVVRRDPTCSWMVTWALVGPGGAVLACGEVAAADEVRGVLAATEAAAHALRASVPGVLPAEPSRAATGECSACGAPDDGEHGHLPHEACDDPEAGPWVVHAHCSACSATGAGICNGGRPWLVGTAKAPLRLDRPRAERLARILNGIRSGPIGDTMLGHGGARVFRAMPAADPATLGLAFRSAGG